MRQIIELSELLVYLFARIRTHIYTYLQSYTHVYVYTCIYYRMQYIFIVFIFSSIFARVRFIPNLIEISLGYSYLIEIKQTKCQHSPTPLFNESLLVSMFVYICMETFVCVKLFNYSRHYAVNVVNCVYLYLFEVWHNIIFN